MSSQQNHAIKLKVCIHVRKVKIILLVLGLLFIQIDTLTREYTHTTVYDNRD